jgi:hypothetical protein
MAHDDSSQSSRLLSLPLELRQQIYTHVFSSFAFSIHRTSPKNLNIVHPYATSSITARNLTLVCHQIRDESLPVLRTHPKTVIFLIRNSFLSREQLPDLILKSHFLAASIRTLIFPTRFGSRRLLAAGKDGISTLPLLPNLRTVGVCRAALGGGTDRVWYRGNGVDTGSEAENPAAVRAWMTRLITDEFFFAGLCQQWLLNFYVDGARKGKVRIWCRVIATREHVEEDQAVWVDLDRRMEVAEWVWCVPTRRGREAQLVNGMEVVPDLGVMDGRASDVVGLDARTYSPPLEAGGGDIDPGLWEVVRWWNPAE